MERSQLHTHTHFGNCKNKSKGTKTALEENSSEQSRAVFLSVKEWTNQ